VLGTQEIAGLYHSPNQERLVPPSGMLEQPPAV
jgi:hypothetical protein